MVPRFSRSFPSRRSIRATSDLPRKDKACSGVTAHDHKTAAVIDDLIEDLAELSALLSPAHDAVTPHSGGRSGRSNHKHYRAT